MALGDPAKTKIFRPDSRFELSFADAVIALARELVDYRSHILTLFSNDFRASYRGAVLGVIWNFILPMLPISVYVLLVSMRVFPAYEGVPPAVYIGFNVTLWFLFTGFINQPIQVVKARNSEVMKTAMPLSATIASTFARLTFDTLVRLGLVIAVVIATNTGLRATAPMLVLVALAGVVFCLGAGLLLSVLNVVLTDIERVVTIVLTYGIFLSGVIFPISSMGPLKALETWNPLAVFIHAARDIVFAGTITNGNALAGWSIAGIVLLLFSARFFYLLEYRIRGLA